MNFYMLEVFFFTSTCRNHCLPPGIHRPGSVYFLSSYMVKKVSNCQHHIALMLHDACLQHVIDILHGLEGVHNHAEASNVELNQPAFSGILNDHLVVGELHCHLDASITD